MTKAKVTWPDGLQIEWNQFRSYGLITGTTDFTLDGLKIALENSVEGDEINLLLGNTALLDAIGTSELAQKKFENVQKMINRYMETLIEAFKAAAKSFGSTIDPDSLDHFIREFTKKPHFNIPIHEGLIVDEEHPLLGESRVCPIVDFSLKVQTRSTDGPQRYRFFYDFKHELDEFLASWLNKSEEYNLQQTVIQKLMKHHLTHATIEVD